MIAVAVVALILISFMRLRNDTDIHPEFVSAYIEIGGHVFPHTSPIFWIILTLMLIGALILLMGIVFFVIMSVRFFRRRRRSIESEEEIVGN